jgi:hypothetical protein
VLDILSNLKIEQVSLETHRITYVLEDRLTIQRQLKKPLVMAWSIQGSYFLTPHCQNKTFSHPYPEQNT